MDKGPAQRAIALLGAVIAVAVAGWAAGSRLAEWRLRAGSDATRRAHEVVMRQRIRGIAIGQRFPEITVWTCDGQRAYRVNDVLPRGGVLILFSPGCPDCLHVVASVAEAATTSMTEQQPVLLLADRIAHADEVEKTMRERGITLRVYCDVSEALRREYNVAVKTAYFRVDSAGLVIAFGVSQATKGGFQEIITPSSDAEPYMTGEKGCEN